MAWGVITPEIHANHDHRYGWWLVFGVKEEDTGWRFQCWCGRPAPEAVPVTPFPENRTGLKFR